MTFLKNYLKTLQSFNRDVKLALIPTVAIGISYYGIFLVLFNLYLLRMGYDAQFIGALNAAGPLGFVVMSFPAGAMNRRFGSRRLLIMAISIYIISFGLIPFADLLPLSWQTPWLFTTYILAFLGGAFYWPNIDVFIMEITEESEQTHAFSIRQALFPLAGFIGSIAAGLLPTLFVSTLGSTTADPAPFRYALFLCSLLYLPALLALLATTNRQQERCETTHAPISSLKPLLIVILPFLFIELLWKGANAAPLNFFNVFLELGLGMETAQIGQLLGFGQLFSAFAALFAPAVTTRFSLQNAVLLSLIGLLISFLLLIWARHWLLVTIGYIGIRSLIAVSATFLIINRLELVESQWWGVLSGAAIASHGIGESGFLYAGGILIDTQGFGAFFWMNAVLVALCIVVYWMLFRQPRQVGDVATDGRK